MELVRGEIVVSKRSGNRFQIQSWHFEAGKKLYTLTSQAGKPATVYNEDVLEALFLVPMPLYEEDRSSPPSKRDEYHRYHRSSAFW